MGITMSMCTLGGLLAPAMLGSQMQRALSRMGRAGPAAQVQRMLSRIMRTRGTSQVQPVACTSQARAHAQRPVARRRPLRVVHVADTSQHGARPGRLVISGRMADVCAELERLAAMEAAAG
jgi:hypothetical protein